MTALAILLVWFALIFPDKLGGFTPSAMLRLPVEGLLLVALCLVLPRAARRVVAALFGLTLALVAMLKILNLGFFSVLGQPFNPLTDGSYLASAVGVLHDTIGPARTVAAVVAASLFLAVVLVVITRSAGRTVRFTAEHRAPSAWAVCSLAVVWLLCALSAFRWLGRRWPPRPPARSPGTEADPALAVEDPFAATPVRNC